jgi:hypothetical protein
MPEEGHSDVMDINSSVFYMEANGSQIHLEAWVMRQVISKPMRQSWACVY